MGEFLFILVLFALFIFFSILAVKSLILRSKMNKQIKELKIKLDNPDIKFNVSGTEFKKNNIENLLKNNKNNNVGKFIDYDKETQQYQSELFKFPMYESMNVMLVKEPNNEYDENAIKVLVDDIDVGYVPSKKNSKLLKELDSYKSFIALISEGTYKPSMRDEGDDEEKFKIKIIGFKSNI